VPAFGGWRPSCALGRGEGATPTPTRTSRPVVEPLTADLRRLHATVSRRFLETLESAKHALSHARPGADAEAILEAGLDLILAQQARRRAQVKRPRKVKAPPAGGADSSHIPAEVRGEAWTRDGGRCQWSLERGDICGSTRRPALDHIHPKARGGPTTVENLRVRCRRHNELAARLAHGDAWMRRFRKPAEGRSGTDPTEGAMHP